MPRVRASQNLDSSELRRYALVGAQARLEAITAELAAIRQAFPELANGNLGAASTTTAGNTASRRRRGRMSAAQRKAVGARMKKYWAARRAASQGTKTESQNEVARGGAQKRARRTGRVKGGRRKMSAAARKRISDAQKARWAKQKRAS